MYAGDSRAAVRSEVSSVHWPIGRSMGLVFGTALGLACACLMDAESLGLIGDASDGGAEDDGDGVLPSTDEPMDDLSPDDDGEDSDGTGGDEDGDSGADATGNSSGTDEDSSDTLTSCSEAWRHPGWTLSEPERLDLVNTSFSENDPFLATDAMALYFSSNRPGGAGGFDLWKATRADVDQSFADPVPVTDMNTAQDEYSFVLAADGRLAYLSSAREGGEGRSDIWQFRRATVGAAWDPPTAVSELNTPNFEADLAATPDGMTIYYSRPDLGDVFWAERGGIDSPFSAAQELVINTPDAHEDAPSVTADSLVLLFSSDRVGGVGGSDLWFATRSMTSEPFGAPQLLPLLNTVSGELEPNLRSDGCELVFARGVAHDDNTYDLYVSRFIAP